MKKRLLLTSILLILTLGLGAFAACGVSTTPTESTLALNKTSLTLEVGAYETLIATGNPSGTTLTWQVQNSTIASVTQNGKVTAKKVGTTKVGVTDGIKQVLCNVTVVAATVKATGVTLNKTTLSFTEGDAAQTLIATVAPTTTTNKNVTWTSSAPSVATVANGVVTPVSAGTAIITVRTADGSNKSATCTVTVTAASTDVAVTSVSLNKTTSNLIVGNTETLIATVAPADATNKNVTWTSSNDAIATVSNAGVVEAIAAGTVTITATTADGNKTATCVYTIIAANVSVESVSLNKTTANVVIGGTETLVANVLPANATNKNVSWLSDNPTVASVVDGVVTANAVGTATITVTTADGGKTATCVITVTPIAVESVSLNKTTASVVIGGTETLIASILPENATNKNATWSSDNETVATVSATGVVTANAVGTANITVTTEDGTKTATCVVTVTPITVTNITLNKTATSIVRGNTETLEISQILPVNATNKLVDWASDNESVATVVNGVVTANAVGTANITVTARDGSGTTATCVVTVTPVSVTGVTLNTGDFTLELGASSQALIANVAPANADNKQVNWSSDNDTVATVVDGVVTANAVGDAFITVTTVDGGFTATVKVTVREDVVPVTSITLDHDTLTFTIGDGAQTLVATVLPSDATDSIVTWSSSDEDVATVVDGVVTAVGVGEATIYASVGGKSDSCVVTVNPVTVTSITLNKTTTAIVKGATETLTVTAVLPETATNKNVIWSSENDTIATVSSVGVVTANAVGTVNIIATAADGSGVTATCVVTVSAVLVESITLNKAATSIVKGQTETLEVTAVLPTTADNKAVDWASDDEEVATVVNGVVTAVSVGTANITATAKDGSGISATCEVTVTPIAVESVTVNATLTVKVGVTSDPLTAVISPANADNKNVTWTSANDAIATVSNTGAVTGVSAGTVNITVTTADGGKTAICAVTVENIDVESVSLNQSALTFTEGDEAIQLTATVLPANATNKAVTWETNAASVATVVNGLVTPVGVGSAIITVKTVDGEFTATCNVTVNAATVSVTGITLNKTTATIKTGKTETLTATVAPENATNKNYTWSVTAGTDVVSVANGVVTALKAGTATVTVTTEDGAKTASCTITVEDIKVTSITLNKTSTTLEISATETLSVTAYAPSDATVKGVTWSSNNACVSVDANTGVITANSAGTATITATATDGSGVTATCTVTVENDAETPSNVAVTGVTLDKATITIGLNSVTLTATVAPENATNKAVTWSVTAGSDVVSVSNGTITGLKEGTATVTVTTADGGKTATCAVTVKALKVSESAITLAPTMTKQLTAYYDSGVSDDTIAWSTESASIATVSNGLVTAVAAGTTKIYAKVGDYVIATCTVTVPSENASAVELNKTTHELQVGGTYQLVASPNGAFSSMTWSSNNVCVSVNASTGLITANSVGTATITVTVNGNITKTCTVTVVSTDVGLPEA